MAGREKKGGIEGKGFSFLSYVYIGDLSIQVLLLCAQRMQKRSLLLLLLLLNPLMRPLHRPSPLLLPLLDSPPPPLLIIRRRRRIHNTHKRGRKGMTRAPPVVLCEARGRSQMAEGEGGGDQKPS